MTANTFGVALCTASLVIRKVCYALAYRCGPKYLPFFEFAFIPLHLFDALRFSPISAMLLQLVGLGRVSNSNLETSESRPG